MTSKINMVGEHWMHEFIVMLMINVYVFSVLLAVWCIPTLPSQKSRPTNRVRMQTS